MRLSCEGTPIWDWAFKASAHSQHKDNSCLAVPVLEPLVLDRGCYRLMVAVRDKMQDHVCAYIFDIFIFNRSTITAGRLLSEINFREVMWCIIDLGEQARHFVDLHHRHRLMCGRYPVKSNWHTLLIHFSGIGRAVGRARQQCG